MYYTTDLIEDVKKDFPHLKNQTIEDAVWFIFDWIKEGVVEADKVIILNFGTFAIRERAMPPANAWNKQLRGEREKTFYQVYFRKSDALREKLRIKDD